MYYLIPIQSGVNSHSIKDKCTYTCLSSQMLTLPFTSILPNHHQDGPFLTSMGSAAPPPSSQAEHADSANLALLAKDGAYAKELINLCLLNCQ